MLEDDNGKRLITTGQVPNPIGNPSNPEELAKKKEIFLEALEVSNGNMSAAAEICGFSKSAVYQWRKKDTKFAVKCATMADIVLDFVEGNLMQQIKSGNSASTIFYLKTKGKGRGYTEKQELDVTGMMNVNMSYGVVEDKKEEAEDQDV